MMMMITSRKQVFFVLLQILPLCQSQESVDVDVQLQLSMLHG
jgi:hypothetical protein